MGWKLVTEPDSLWASILGSKYLNNSSFFNCEANSKSSYTWRSILRGKDILKMGSQWVIWNGQRAKFWLDWWVGEGPLVDVATQQIPPASLNARVCDYIDEDGNLKWSYFVELIPMNLIPHIRAIKPFQEDNCTDSLIWRDSPSGNLSTKSAYALVTGQQRDVEAKKWQAIWKGKPIPKIKYFLWLARQDRLLTNKVRVVRHLTTDGSCKECSHNMEDSLHVLRDCPIAKHLWMQLLPESIHQHFFPKNLEEWIDMNMGCDMESISHHIPWQTIFAQATWSLWTWRKKRIFEQGFSNPANPMEIILLKAQETDDSLKVESMKPTKTQNFIAWN